LIPRGGGAQAPLESPNGSRTSAPVVALRREAPIVTNLVPPDEK